MSIFSRLAGRRVSPPGKPCATRHTPRSFECLERRELLTSFLVNVSDNSLGDSYSADGICDTTGNPSATPPVPYSGQCTLNAAIEQSNSTPEKDTILIGVAEVLVNSVLPNVTAPIDIAPSGTSKAVLSGTLKTLNIQGGESSVENIIFQGVGLGISEKGGNIVRGNYIGAYDENSLSQGTLGAGVTINGSSNNTIGGTEERHRNVISGHNYGVWIINQSNGNVVQGNYIGVDVTGTLGLGNRSTGVYVQNNSNGNLIGGPTETAGNIISSNAFSGVFVDRSSNNAIQGNKIGTDVSGTVAFGNEDGIYLLNAAETTIGGPELFSGNTIAGNRRDGVRISGTASVGTILEGNVIGTSDPFSIDELGNANDGIFILDAPNSRIGGAVAGQGNTISGNGDDGIQIQGESASDSFIQGNLIGTDSSGTFDVGNKGVGIFITRSPRNQIGGENSAGNLISGNDKSGIIIQNVSATDNTIVGNLIGTTADGVSSLPNEELGIFINDAPQNMIGGSNGDSETLVNGNLISGNKRDGILIAGKQAAANVIRGNYIGTNIDGSDALPNEASGVYILSPETSIGTSTSIAAMTVRGDNLISGNKRYGIEIINSDATKNVVRGNFIGSNATGDQAVPNELGGIHVHDAPENTIGGDNLNEPRLRYGNLISGNRFDGLRIRGERGSLVQGNYIGSDVTGSVPLGNGRNGINIENSRDTLMGLKVLNNSTGAQNLVSANGANGIRIFGSQATNNIVRGALIGTDITGTFSDTDGNPLNDNTLGNQLNGILITGAPGNKVEGPGTSAGTIVSGNNQNGISIELQGATGNRITNAYVGADITGEKKLGNRLNGVHIVDAPQNTIGGTRETLGNLIVGNERNGIHIVGSHATKNVVQANKIGIYSVDTTIVLSNQENGVLIENAPENFIGSARARNLISGNGQNGVKIWKSESTNNRLINNYIGLNLTGAIDVDGQNIGNVESGVAIVAASDNVIGGIGESERNTISGNNHGVWISGFDARGNLVQNNYIGTDPSGTNSRPNKETGAWIDAASVNHIGGQDASSGNLISGNGTHGVRITGATAQQNLIDYNRVGTDMGGTTSVANQQTGIVIEDGANNNRIDFNLVSGNNKNGVRIGPDQSNANQLRGNLIGTDRIGTAKLSNLNSGVAIRSSNANVLDDNLISGNGIFGVELTSADQNVIKLNRIGTDFLGNASLGNGNNGIHAVISDSNQIHDNQVSGNENNGIYLAEDSVKNDIAANLIGTAANGLDPLGNVGNGVVVTLDANDNRIAAGGLAGQPNAIAHNGENGILVLQSSSGNLISENAIFANLRLGIDLHVGNGVVLPGVTPNDRRDADGGSNRFQNFPVVHSVTDLGANYRVEASLDSTPNKAFTIELFSNPICDPSGHGEGLTFVGSQVVNTNVSGNVEFSFVGVPLPAGAVITMTARDNQTNDTSEFSACRPTIQPTPGTIQGRKIEDLNRDGVGTTNEPGRGGFTIELVDSQTGIVVDRTETAGPAAICAPGEHFLERCDSGIDSFSSVASLEIDFNLDDTADSFIMLNGLTTLERGTAQDALVGDPALGDVGTVDGHADVAEIEFVSWNLGGPGFQLRAGDGVANLQSDSSFYSGGTLQETPEDSSAVMGQIFVYFELETALWTLHNTEPLELHTKLAEIYPSGPSALRFDALLEQPLVLYDESGIERARLHDLVHTRDESGRYVFNDVAPGEYIVREVPEPGWTQIEPRPTYTVVITPGDFEPGYDFVNQRDLPVEGRVLGDSNGDGIFNSSDLVKVFVAGEYEDDIENNSTFEEGDWNGDGDFDSGDLVAAFQANTYVAEARPSAIAAAIDFLFSDDKPKTKRSR